MAGKVASAPRVAALVGPYLSGKTSLMEGLLHLAGAVPKKGRASDGFAVGDPSLEAKARQMSVETTVATAQYLGETWTFLDCPGSVEFAQEALHALRVADLALVVVEPDPAKAAVVGPLLKALDDQSVPHVLFINKTDAMAPDASLAEVAAALQAVSQRPLVLREIPLREGGKVTGFVDLAAEKAYRWGQDGADAALQALPESLLPEEQQARQELLEHLADFDDHLLEELLSDVAPSSEEVYGDLAKELAADQIVPVFFGSAEKGFGLKRLMKALRHEAPEPSATAARLGIPEGGGFLGQVFKTVHAPHVGKLSLTRVWRGEVKDGQPLDGMTVGGVFRLFGNQPQKVGRAEAGELVALGHLDKAHTGQALGAPSSSGGAHPIPWAEPLQPVYGMSLKATKAQDEVKLTGALAKLCEEDPSLQLEQRAESHELVLWGQGEIHLKVALDRLKSRFGLEVHTDRPQVPYRETIRRPVTQHGRFKHQSGGHGAFGDVHLEIRPLGRGEGFQFSESVVGGVVPRQFFGSVEKGVVDYMRQGPLGFPVVDLAVNLHHGSYHSVDSSDMAFQQAARIAMSEGMPKAEPVLLEPVVELKISVPSEHTPKAQRLVTSHRGGQILGFEGKEDWSGWDVVSAYLPMAEIHELIIELRSSTQGVGHFTWRTDHLQEVVGREADRVAQARKKALA